MELRYLNQQIRQLNQVFWEEVNIPQETKVLTYYKRMFKNINYLKI